MWSRSKPQCWHKKTYENVILKPWRYKPLWICLMSIRHNPEDDLSLQDALLFSIVSENSSFFWVSAWRGGPARRASCGSHRIPCPIAGRCGLKWGRITLSQQTTGNRKTESAASRRSSQPSTISYGLIKLHLHLLHQNRSFSLVWVSWV